MPSPELLPEFVAVVEEGSISKASRKLRVPRASLSRRLSALEEELGVRLLLRKTRPLRLTNAGEELYGRARRLVDETEQAWDAVRIHDRRPRGRLRVSLPPNAPLFVRYVTDFAKAFPEVQLVVTTDARHVDLAAEGIDVALRVGEIRDPDLIARKLWQSDVVLAAAPAYLAQAGAPTCPAELAHHACLVGFRSSPPIETQWPLLDGGTQPIKAQMLTSDIAVILEASRSGAGIALLPKDLIRDELDAGELVVLLEGIVGTTTVGHLVYADRRFLSPQLRAFVEALVERTSAPIL